MDNLVEETPAKPPSLFSFAGFRNLWIGQLISQFGDVLHGLVFLWMILDVTKDPRQMGIVGAFEALPAIVFAVHAGVWADRHDRKAILIWTDWFAAVLVIGFAFLVLWIKVPSLPVVCLFAFALKSMTAFAAPARGAAIPNLVPSERLLQANALNATLQNVMPLIGNALSAMVLQVIFSLSRTLTYFVTFVFNGLTFIVSALFMLRLPSLVPERHDERQSAWNEMKEGIRFVRGEPVLTVAITLSLMLNFFVAPFMPSMVMITKQRFAGTPSMLAFLEMGFFVGMALGAVILSKIRIRRVGVAFSVSLTFAALMFIPMGYTYDPKVFWTANFLCGICIPPAAIPMNTLTQLRTPDALRGRVNSVTSMSSMLIMPIGYALSGILLARLGITGTFWFMTVGLGLAPLFGLLHREFRGAVLEGTGEAS